MEGEEKKWGAEGEGMKGEKEIKEVCKKRGKTVGVGRRRRGERKCRSGRWGGRKRGRYKEIRRVMEEGQVGFLTVQQSY